MVAARAISAGERILAEAPLFTASNSFNANAMAEVLRIVLRLPPADAAAFNALHTAACHTQGPAAFKIFKTNSLPLGNAPNADGGLFLLAARINHSCTPNVVHRWSPALRQEVIHANRDIVEGEELTTCYLEPAQPRAERQAFLASSFGFLCRCAACELSGGALAASDRARSRVRALEDEIYAEISRGRFRRGVTLVEECIATLRAEGIGFPALLSPRCYDAYQACKAAKWHQDARRWLEEALLHALAAGGPEDPEVLLYRDLLARPLTAPHVHP